MAGTLTRDDIIDGVGEVIARLRASGTRATIQIVGGAAIARPSAAVCVTSTMSQCCWPSQESRRQTRPRIC